MQKPLLRLGTLTHASFEFRKSLQYYNKYVMNKNINVYFTEVLKLVCACGILVSLYYKNNTDDSIRSIQYEIQRVYLLHGEQFTNSIVCVIIPIYAYNS